MILYFFPQGHDIDPTSYIDVQVMMVLPSIMIMNFLLLRQSWFFSGIKYLQHLIRNDIDKGFYAVSILSFLISPFIMNDGLCLMLVHPVLDSFSRDSRSTATKNYAPTDPFYFMLTIACSANIGSVLTYSGNPQNLIVASFLSSYMNCGFFFFLMLIPSVISWCITVSLINYYRKQAAVKAALDAANEETISIEMTETSNALLDADRNSGVQRRNPANTGKHKIKSTNSEKNIDEFYPAAEEEEDERSSRELLMTTKKEDEALHRRHQAQQHHNQQSGRIQNFHSADYYDNDTTGIDELALKNVFSQDESESADIEHQSPKTNSNRSHQSTTSSSYHPPSDQHTVKLMNRDISMDELNMNKALSDLNHPAEDNPVALSWYVFGMLALLIVLEFTGIFPLTGLFSIITVSILVTVILINYYRSFYGTSTISSSSSGGFQALSTPEKIKQITAIVEEFFHEVDYNLLIIFMGLFVVSGTFLETLIPKSIWEALAGSSPFQTSSSIIVLSIYIIVTSQLVGNVPVVYMAKEEVQTLDRIPQIFGWLILAWVSTIAGNFTLVGSAANIIVAEKAMR
jgi:Na+/H+ antiporter NhaD/arsenite permease-like protein